MVYLKAFRGLRPAAELAKAVSAPPYDVIDRKEAKALAAGNDVSILHVTRAEIDVDDSVDDYDDSVYAKGRENLLAFIEKGILRREERPVFYIYREEMGETVQTGIVGTVAVADYVEGRVMKHELTRKEKEADRIRHFDVCDCQTEPVFLTYRHSDTVDGLIAKWLAEHEPLFSFTADDGVGHTLWVVDDDDVVAAIAKAFAVIDKVYIADGHHRTASAAAVCEKRRRENAAGDGESAADFVMAVIFPDRDLKVIDYNRVVALDADFDEKDLFAFLNGKFRVEPLANAGKPEAKHDYTMYLKGKWYRLTADSSLYAHDDVAANFDTAILQSQVLKPYFGIDDPRTDPRIDFIGGIRGVKEIVRRCDEENRVGFCLYPVAITDLMAVSDAGKIMAPKSTWFEPKLRSGLFLHELGEGEGKEG